MGKVIAVCRSEQKGTQKENIYSAEFQANWGMDKDAHVGNWHRQVSLLSYDKIQEFRKKGADVEFGAFGENLVVDKFDFRSLPVGTRFQCNDVVLEMTQIGKECHTHCQIYRKVGDCIMPREGVFAKVIHGGTISVGDEMIMIEKNPNILTAAVITLSDKGYVGERVDESGPIIEEILNKCHYEVIETLILPDEPLQIQKELIRLSDGRQANIIITTGGTGFSVRDCTPEATLAVATRIVPGIAEAIRYNSMQYTKRAMLSRGVSVIRNQTLIINLPGSPKAVRESLDYVKDELEHGIKILIGTAKECSR